MTWETVIGLEVHAQLQTHSKLFSSSSTVYGAPPNTQTHYIDAGFPGTLPVLNKKALYLAVQFGLAIGAKINQNAYFERKNYVYPDLPKGYQISQLRRPIVGSGHVNIVTEDGESKSVVIDHAHLEEDAGKSLHNRPNQTAIDLNRAGIPLLEIVTTPCLSSASDVVRYLKTLNQLLRFLNICNGNMQEGSFRCDVNISLKQPHSQILGTKVELKNLNSFRFIEKAIVYEQHRQATLLDSNQLVEQETRLFNETTGCTEAMRDKESVCDYRYFADPDLLPIHIDAATLKTLAAEMPELPKGIRIRLRNEGISNQEDIDFLLSSPAIFHFFSAVQQQSLATVNVILKWLKGPLVAELKLHNLSFESTALSAERFALLLNNLNDQTISDATGKKILNVLFTSNESVSALIALHGYITLSNEQLQQTIEKVLSQYPQQALLLQQGDQKILSFLTGQTMKAVNGQADAKHIQQLLLKAIAT